MMKASARSGEWRRVAKLSESRRRASSAAAVPAALVAVSDSAVATAEWLSSMSDSDPIANYDSTALHYSTKILAILRFEPPQNS